MRRSKALCIASTTGRRSSEMPAGVVRPLTRASDTQPLWSSYMTITMLGLGTCLIPPNPPQYMRTTEGLQVSWLELITDWVEIQGGG